LIDIINKDNIYASPAPNIVPDLKENKAVVVAFQHPPVNGTFISRLKPGYIDR
jgi:hypothetical protein